MTDSHRASVLDANLALRELRAKQVAENLQRAAHAQAMQAEIDAMSVSRWSRRREVNVTVASSGLLTGIEYSEQAEGMNSTALASLTMQTIREAMAEVQKKIDEITTADVVADGGPANVAADIRNAYHRSFAEPLSHLDPEPPTLN